MKIVNVIPTFNRSKGGKEILNWHLVRRWLTRGHQVVVITHEYETMDHPNLSFRTVPSWGKALGLRRRTFAHHARRAVRSMDRDVVFSHGRAGFGEVVRIGGLPLREHLRVMSREASTLTRRIYYRIKPYVSLSTWHSLALEDRSFRQAELRTVIVASQLIKRHLLAAYPSLREASDERVRVIPNGIDREQFNLAVRRDHRQSLRERYSIGEDDIVGIFVGNDFYRKGFMRLLPFFGRHEDLHLLAVGRAENFSTEDKKAFRERLGDRFHFVGEVQDVRPYYAASDCLVFPTRTDGFGLVVPEALAMGLYVIVTDRCGAGEIITKPWQGQRVESMDHVRFGPRVRQWIRSPDWVNRRSEHGRGYSLGNMVTEYLEVLRQASYPGSV